LLNSLDSLASPNIAVQIGSDRAGRTIRLQITEEET